jgi:hypothetical protein
VDEKTEIEFRNVPPGFIYLTGDYSSPTGATTPCCR